MPDILVTFHLRLILRNYGAFSADSNLSYTAADDVYGPAPEALLSFGDEISAPLLLTTPTAIFLLLSFAPVRRLRA